MRNLRHVFNYFVYSTFWGAHLTMSKRTHKQLDGDVAVATAKSARLPTVDSDTTFAVSDKYLDTRVTIRYSICAANFTPVMRAEVIAHFNTFLTTFSLHCEVTQVETLDEHSTMVVEIAPLKYACFVRVRRPSGTCAPQVFVLHRARCKCRASEDAGTWVRHDTPDQYVGTLRDALGLECKYAGNYTSPECIGRTGEVLRAMLHECTYATNASEREVILDATVWEEYL